MKRIYKNTLAELVNELKDLIGEFKEIISVVKKSEHSAEKSLQENGDENKQEQQSRCKNIEDLETKLKTLENKLLTHFGENICDEVDQTDSHPLARNHLMLRYIFEMLDLPSLKSCRQVCKYWEELSEPIFTKRVKIEFRSYPESKSLEKFTTDFLANAVSCNTFVFDSFLICSLSAFAKFFRFNYEIMTSLEMSHTQLKDEDGKVHSYNIGNLFGPNILNLKIIGSFSLQQTQIILSVDRLKCIEKLHLELCILVIPEETCRIQPKEINLDAVSFTRENGEHIGDLRLNDFIDFDRCTKIEFNGSYNFNAYQERASIEFPPGIEIESVSLTAINYTYNLNNKPKIKNIRMNSTEFNFNFLSEEVESLDFNSMADVNHQNIFLPNLKCLILSRDNQNFLPALPIFKNCPNLVAVSLRDIQDNPLECDLNLLPQFVEKVKLDGIRIIGDRLDRQLTSLHLLNYSLQSIQTILSKFTTDNLYVSIIEWRNSRRLPSVATDILLSIFRQPYKKFAIGKIMWSDQDNFRNSEFSQLVDKRSECYLFEDRKGKSIPDSELEDFMKLFP